MYRLGLFEVFHAKWFLFALGFLVVNVTVCTFNRWSPTFRNVFHPPRARARHASSSARTTARCSRRSTPATLEAQLRALRFKVKTRDARRRDVPLRRPLSVDAARDVHQPPRADPVHLRRARHVADGLHAPTSSPARARRRRCSPSATRTSCRCASTTPSGRSATQGNALDFRTHLTIFKNGQQVAQGTTTVNDPFKYGGYRFHQVGVLRRWRRAADPRPGDRQHRLPRDVPAARTRRPRRRSRSPMRPARRCSRDTIAPTDFLDDGERRAGAGARDGPRASGSASRRRTTSAWQLVAFDPQGGSAGRSAGRASTRARPARSAASTCTSTAWRRCPSAVGARRARAAATPRRSRSSRRRRTAATR